jgi:hypothetical protein
MKGPFKLFVEGGHAFEVDENGDLVDWMQEYHDGYHCILCFAAPCRNCDPDWQTQQCPENLPPLPGLELEVT